LSGSLADPKPPINTLIHEIGHMKWPNLGQKEENHDIRFYALLFNALVNLGIAPDWSQDLQRQPDNPKKSGDAEARHEFAAPRREKQSVGFQLSP
jgi:hypothetical protein